MEVGDIWYGRSRGYNMSAQINFYRVKNITRSGRWRLEELVKNTVNNESKENDRWMYHLLHTPTDEATGKSILVTHVIDEQDNNVYYSKSTEELLYQWDGTPVEGVRDTYN